MKKYDYINLMKTIAMFMVILAHCILFWGNNMYWPMRADRESTVVIFIYNFFDVACLPIFVFSAGFLFQYSIQRKDKGTLNLIWKKVQRLIIPCFIYGSLWVVPLYTYLDIPVFGRDKGTSLLDGYISMLLGRFADVNWFLFMLFWVSLIWILARLLLKRERIILGAIAALVFFFIAHFWLCNLDFYKISQIDIHILEYFTGAVFFFVADYFQDRFSARLEIILSAALLAVCVFLAQLIAEYYAVACLLRIVIPVFFVVFSIGLGRLDIAKKLESTRAFKWLTENNLYVYLFQAPGVYTGFMIFNPILGKDIPLCVLVIFIYVLITDVILVLIFNCIMNFLRKLFP